MPRDYVFRKHPPIPLTVLQRRRVAENLGLVGAVVREVRWCGLSYDELFSAGSLGLCRAAQTFDEGRGLAFSTYAHPAIKQAMIAEVREQRMIHVPKCRPKRFGDEWDRARGFRVRSILGGEEDFDRIDPATAPDPHDAGPVRLEALTKAIEGLNLREKAIVRGMLEGLSGAEIGRRVGLTRSMISKIERHVMEVLRYEILSRESRTG